MILTSTDKFRTYYNMAKISCIIAILISLVVFNSCSNSSINKTYSKTPTAQAQSSGVKKAYGAYLAGRVAHLRKNFNTAADYYMIALNEDPENEELLSRIYVILASKGRIPEAAKYAEMSLKNGDKNNFTHIIIATNEMKQGQYAEAIKSLNNLNGQVYEEFITPLMSSWAYVGLNQPDKALKTLEVIKKEPSFRALYHFHAGMINDYFDRTDEARKNYEIIVNEESTEMSFRALQVITNFYIRNGEKDKAIALSEKYNDDKLLADMLRNLASNNRNANPDKTEKIVNDPNVGMSEALFSIAATMRQGASGVDIAHIFICLSIYSNPKYDLAKLLLADILESREMYTEANEVYDEIPQDSETYSSIQLKKASNYVMLQDYPAAEILLKSLAEEKPGNYQIMMDLGDILRIRGNNEEAIEYYENAISLIKKTDNSQWVLYYALGISYEQLGKWEKAETNLKKALEMSQNHYYVQNYLGYSWLRMNKNINEAFALIADAYNQAPNDGHIADSLGWAFYKLGRYDDAVVYLEKASEIEPANALINDHLGDAYWQSNRKNEAVFQWEHTLKMKDDSGEVNFKDIKKKIAQGMTPQTPLAYDKETIEEKIKTLPAEE